MSCATPDCQYCVEEKSASALDDLFIGIPCGDELEPGITCTRARGHEGSHTDGGDEWSPAVTPSPAIDQDDCEYCGKEPADRECSTCVNERWGEYMREALERMKTVAPGLTNSEVALLERFIEAAETS